MNTKKTAANGARYDIVAGPSRDTLFDACKYAYSKTARVNINFLIPIGYTAPAGDPTRAYIAMPISDILVKSIEHENGSGESFNLVGECKVSLNSFNRNTERSVCRFEAYYDTKRRTGCIFFFG